MDESEEETLSEAEMTEEEEEDGDGSRVISAIHLGDASRHTARRFICHVAHRDVRRSSPSSPKARSTFC